MNTSLTVVARYGRDVLFETISAPIWWFTVGVTLIARSAFHAIARTADTAEVGVWLKNILVPMYGQSDAWGRVISFLIRLANVIGRLMWVSAWSVGVIVGHFVFAALPFLALYIFLSAVMRIAA